MLSSTIDPTGTAQHRDQSIFTFASKRQAQRSKNPNRHPRNAPHQPTTTHFPQQDKILEQNTAPGSYVPSYDNSPPAASISFGFSERLPKSSKLPGEGTANYNPLGMRGPGAHIFKGTCKWYNSQRGFGFIIPVRVHDRSRTYIVNAPLYVYTKYNILLFVRSLVLFHRVCLYLCFVFYFLVVFFFSFFVCFLCVHVCLFCVLIFILLLPQDNTKTMFGDVFVHHTVIHAKGFRSLNTGETVEFTVIQKQGKWHATSVTGPNSEYVEGLSKLLPVLVCSVLHGHLACNTHHANTHTHTHTHTHTRNMRLSPSTCATVAVTPTAVVVSSSGAPWLAGVVRCGTRGVLLALVNERKDAWRAFGSATASCCTGKQNKKESTSKSYARKRKRCI